jgi:hypothetical protein
MFWQTIVEIREYCNRDRFLECEISRMAVLCEYSSYIRTALVYCVAVLDSDLALVQRDKNIPHRGP